MYIGRRLYIGQLTADISWTLIIAVSFVANGAHTVQMSIGNWLLLALTINQLEMGRLFKSDSLILFIIHV